MVTSFLEPTNSKPSYTTWCALQTRSKSLSVKNFYKISTPYVKLTPLSLFTFHPLISLSGSDHSKSQRGPSYGTYVGRLILQTY
jgi:hypothetical protein